MNAYTRLSELAHNLRWDWHDPTRELFRTLDPTLWETTGHNPVALLRRLDPDEVNGREDLAGRIRSLHEELREYLAGDRWYEGPGDPARPLVAYFSAEFGLVDCLRIYSGGLGVLAGDHLKSASDLGVPLVGVGLLYREGYFQQDVDPRGRQTETFPIADFEDLPVRPAVRDDGSPVRVSVPFPGRQLQAQVWRANVGRVPLYLLDTDVPENSPEDRRLTARLYGGGHRTRISQELLLGIGGYRALAELGIQPAAFHMNEGHSAFLALELARELIQTEKLSFHEATAAVRARCVFTTHTPVPAGHDRFARDLVESYLTRTAHALGLGVDQLMDLGREIPGEGPFTMTVLAMRMAERINGVSQLHGAVTRSMWHQLWPDRPVDEVPIDHITNGIHAATWVHPDVAASYGVGLDDLGIGDDRPEPDLEALWRIRNERRAALIAFLRRTIGADLDPEVLTIGFARRFATYKRATLVLGDEERLDRLVNGDRPIQLIFAGKAHPQDEGGKALIRRIGEIARDDRFRNRILFLPGYGIDRARPLVHGADVWLNNPRRPMEASGTSGMKAAMNGVLNVSVLDGWWEEAWNRRDRDAPAPGWAIGEGAHYQTREEADREDAEALLRVLENEVAPLFYDRPDGIPHGWLERAQQSIRQVAPVFNSHRMLTEYVERYRAAARLVRTSEAA
jgi:starch phosphorylase